jgi:transcriptional repressor NrdR
MRCSLCFAEDTRVVDSRPSDRGAAIRRRRECSACGHRFTTYERAELTIRVRKRSGDLEAFDHRKIRRGVESALADRPVLENTIDRIVARVEAMAAAQGPEISADEIGRVVLAELRKTDEVAYLRFASVYKEFTGAQDFEREMAALEDDV